MHVHAPSRGTAKDLALEAIGLRSTRERAGRRGIDRPDVQLRAVEQGQLGFHDHNVIVDHHIDDNIAYDDDHGRCAQQNRPAGPHGLLATALPL
jgi:hypothetical protein